ncbi:hypothetical protein CEK71_14985 [Methylovulum psychrotolerans]|uniref:HD-GYP domain-containing protein n=2 Tax=Methylovulum psychrotolerans TaxID=1704499 RepID=A0A1Z4C5L4_9GAMM|nr:hypothetical protein CEK71_14985 [Methylovulum psychrotolerans]
MVSPVTVRSWAQKGVLVAKVMPGGHRRFLKSDVENFVRDSGATYVEAKPSISRILIVDNDPLMMTYVYDILNGSGLGFVLATAQNGFEAGAKMYVGAQLCASLKEMESTVQIIRSHHERWNGSGYPDGLKGEAIPLLARTFQIVDIFDVLTSPRPYKPTLDFTAAIDVIKQEIAEQWLDPQLGRIFLELLATRPQDFAVISAIDSAA